MKGCDYVDFEIGHFFYAAMKRSKIYVFNRKHWRTIFVRAIARDDIMFI